MCSWNKVQPPLLAYVRGSSCKLTVNDTWFYKREKNKLLVQCIKVMGRWMIAACTFLCLVESESKLSDNKCFSLFLLSLPFLPPCFFPNSLPSLSPYFPSLIFKKHYVFITENIPLFESHCFQANEWKEEKSSYKSRYTLFII